MRFGKGWWRNMKEYKVEIDSSAREDIEELAEFLSTKLSLEGARKYLDSMIQEVLSLSVYADVYFKSRSKTIKIIHPQARRMVSHNKKCILSRNVSHYFIIYTHKIYPINISKDCL